MAEHEVPAGGRQTPDAGVLAAMMDEMERPRRGGRAPAGRAKARRGRAASVSSEEDAEEGEESDLGPESDGEVSDADAGAPEGMNVECENALEEDADMAASDDGDGDGRGVEEELEQENMEEVVSEPRGKRARVTGRAGSGRRALRERS